MVKSTDCFPSFGVFQGLRYDSAVQVKAVAMIAHAAAIEYLTEEGLDHALISCRDVFGVTYTSRRDTRRSADVLLENGFDFEVFKQTVEDRLSGLSEKPVALSSACIGDLQLPRYVGVRLHQSYVSDLVCRAAIAREAANQAGGACLPIRTKFSHLSLLRYGNRSKRPPLKEQQSATLRTIVASAKEEVGLTEVYFGKLAVGIDIDKPLPDELYSI